MFKPNFIWIRINIEEKQAQLKIIQKEVLILFLICERQRLESKAIGHYVLGLTNAIHDFYNFFSRFLRSILWSHCIYDIQTSVHLAYNIICVTLSKISVCVGGNLHTRSRFLYREAFQQIRGQKNSVITVNSVDYSEFIKSVEYSKCDSSWIFTITFGNRCERTNCRDGKQILFLIAKFDQSKSSIVSKNACIILFVTYFVPPWVVYEHYTMWISSSAGGTILLFFRVF